MVVLGALAVAAGLGFIALIVVPWLAYARVLTIPWLRFAQPGARLSTTDVATVTVAGATGLLALSTVLLAVSARRAVAAVQRAVEATDTALTSSQDQVKVAQQQLGVGFDLVEASNRQAAAAQRALEASFRPLLSEVPRGFRTYPESGREIEVVRDQVEHIEDESQVIAGAEYGRPGYYSVALRNVGTGPAVVTDVRLQAGDVAWHECTISAAVVPPGELSRFTFTIPADRDALVPIRNDILRSNTMLVVVGYTDQAGLHRIRTEAHLSRFQNAGAVSPWYVRQVATFEGDGDEPIVKSAAADPYGIPR